MKGHPSPPAWLWLWFAPAIVVLQVVAKAADEDFYRRFLRGETGFVENATVILLVFCIVTAVRCFTLRDRVASALFGPAMLAFALGCFVFAGEEASWGQHWLGFEPPESIAARNDQAEFNLHNDPFFETFLDQLPRLGLTLFALVGGIIAPIVRRRRGRTAPEVDGPGIWGWVWPTAVCIPSALLVVLVTLPEKIFERVADEVPAAVDISPGETKEFGLALFLLVYVVTLFRTLRAAPPAAFDGRS